jgi:EAL domain-containing protein (putative c-di-GMP-specific phosphodiesterase class I)
MQPTIGIAKFPDHGRRVAELLMHADTAMQISRADVSAPAIVYSEEMGRKSRLALRLDSDLKRAVREEQLILYYQPKIRLSDDKLAGVEALLRWFHPELGQISPAQFIPLAEESGLILELGDWIVRAAFRQMLQWHTAGFDTSVAVNFAGTQFTHGEPARVIADAANAVGLEPGRLLAEITESTFIGDLDKVQKGIAAVRALGCRVAVDDFGTGYSSLAYLRGLPADELKVDRAFIHRVDVDPVDSEIYSAVLALARKLRLSVTAEGVETPGQLEWLRAHGCTEVQGFLIAKPMPGHELLKRYGSGREDLAAEAG